MQDIESFSEDNRMLIADLRDPDADVRLATLFGISAEVDDELAGELERMLLEDESEGVRAQVPITFGPVLEMCYFELDDEGRLLCFECLGETPAVDDCRWCEAGSPKEPPHGFTPGERIKADQ